MSAVTPLTVPKSVSNAVNERGIFWLASYPKSGNTWFRAYIANLQLGEQSDVDINALDVGEIASSRSWLDDLLGFDSADLHPEEIERLRPEVYRWTVNREAKSYGYHKIHDAYIRLDSGEPMVSREATLGALYIIRNPLDVAISASHHWGCDIDKAIKNMGKADFGISRNQKGLQTQVEQRMFSWSQHILSWVDAEDLNCCVIRYEDMLADGFKTFSKATEFLRLTTDDDAITRAIAQSDFKALSAQEAAKGFRERSAKAEKFFRSGKAGGWRDVLSTEQVARIVDDHRDVMQRFGYLNGDTPI